MKRQGVLVCLLAGAVAAAVPAAAQQPTLQLAAPERGVYAVISDVDLYCSFVLLEEVPSLRIVASEREGEKILLSDNDIVYLSQGRSAGLKEGQVFAVLEPGPAVKSAGVSGIVAFGRGRVRIVRLEDERAHAVIEKGCGQVEIGDVLAPFEAKEVTRGKETPYLLPLREDAATGRFIYMENDLNQIGLGNWGLIDLGKDHGIQAGQQLAVFNKPAAATPYQAIANIIVIQAGARSATIRVLSAKDAIRIGDTVQAK